MRYRWLFPLSPAVLALVTVSCGVRARGPLDRIAQVAALPLEVAGRRLAVRLEGWVTLADPAAHIFFMEDGTGAARIELPFTHAGIRPGDNLAIRGVVGEGGPAPTIVATAISVLPGRHELRAVPPSPRCMLSVRKTPGAPYPFTFAPSSPTSTLTCPWSP